MILNVSTATGLRMYLFQSQGSTSTEESLSRSMGREDADEFILVFWKTDDSFHLLSIN